MCDDGSELLAEGIEYERRAARETAAVLERIARFVALHPGREAEFVPLEIAAAFRWTLSYTHHRIALAVALTTRLPRTFEQFQAGAIDEYTARRMMCATEVLSDEAAAQVDVELAPRAGEWNAGQLNGRLRRAVIRADPAAAAARAAAQSAARRLRHETLEDGAGLLVIQGDVERTQLADCRVRAIAKKLKVAGDERTLDQIGSDVALDLLAGKGFENATVLVRVTLPASTALGIDEKPGYLVGYGSIPAQRALEMAAAQDATWQRVLTDPLTGQAIDVGRAKYAPPAALRDHTNARWPLCTGPGCTRPAHQCDLDHVDPFPYGATDSENIRPACRSHHRAKTLGRWRVKHTATGLVWITSHGYHFTHTPEPIDDPEPIPF
jgi:hypothetical protein